MKKTISFNLCLLTAFLAFLLIAQPTTIIFYAKEEERQYWELVSHSASQEGIFTNEPQEVVFVYRKKTVSIPSRMLTIEYPTVVVPPGQKPTTQYGTLLGNLSGIFLFGSTRL
ncbi:hypothetical protein [Enterococcus rotai]|uniref:hypothetical protein n=1 Tax=Enterococcus rotai TaxID=118060 RepID=UPI0035C67764